MYSCGRCGASFSPLRIPAQETCPRCRAREGVRAPLTFSLFEGPIEEVAPPADGSPADPARSPEVDQGPSEPA